MRDCSTCLAVPTAGRDEPRKTVKCEKPGPPVFAMQKLGKVAKATDGHAQKITKIFNFGKYKLLEYFIFVKNCTSKCFIFGI